MSFGALFGLIMWTSANVFLFVMAAAFLRIFSETTDGNEGCGAMILFLVSAVAFAASVAGEIAVYS